MEAVAIGEALQKLISVEKCRLCEVRPIHPPHTVCKRCVDVLTREQNITPRKAFKLLQKEVECRYIEAELNDLEPELKERILSDGDIYLYGDVGVGKTYAMAALTKYYILKGYNCKCVNFDELCKLIRRTYTTNESELDTIYPIINVDKLFIDDLGLRSTPESDFAYGTLYSIFNKRQERYLPTYITSNKTIQQIGISFDLRVADRLKWAVEIEMKGKSRREVPNTH